MSLALSIFLYKNTDTGEQFTTYLKPEFVAERNKLLRKHVNFITIGKFKLKTPEVHHEILRRENRKCNPCKLN